VTTMWELEFELAKQSAAAAGAYLREGGTTAASGQGAGWRDIKLHADREAEDIILRELRAGSDYPVLAEESGTHNLAAADATYWIVDPLDGSLNYNRGIPFSCVSIGLWQGERPVLGVVVDVRSDNVFSGVVGQGAWCNEQPVSVSGVTDPKDAVLATGFPVSRDFGPEAVGRFVEQIRSFKKVRLFGSAALSLAYTACGWVDAYAEEGIMLWDVAAGIALVESAGGEVTINESACGNWARDVMAAATPTLCRVLGGGDTTT